MLRHDKDWVRLGECGGTKICVATFNCLDQGYFVLFHIQKQRYLFSCPRFIVQQLILIYLSSGNTFVASPTRPSSNAVFAASSKWAPFCNRNFSTIARQIVSSSSFESRIYLRMSDNVMVPLNKPSWYKRDPLESPSTRRS